MPKILRVRVSSGHEKFLPQNFKLITDAIHDWKLDLENFFCEKIFFFEQNLAKPQNI